MCWIHDGIAINTRQLRLLVGKCKSTINAMFQSIGYATIPSARDYANTLVEIFPVLKDNFAELRRWTVRFSHASLREVLAAVVGESPTLPVLGENGGQGGGNTAEGTFALAPEMKQ
jgi:hypothetical protein